MGFQSASNFNFQIAGDTPMGWDYDELSYDEKIVYLDGRIADLTSGIEDDRKYKNPVVPSPTDREKHMQLHLGHYTNLKMLLENPYRAKQHTIRSREDIGKDNPYMQ
jgi:hypothetical protein